MRRLPAIALALLTAGALASAHATSVKHYSKGEYLVIEDGLSPDKKLSIAAHGDGEDGDDNFHLYLMAEPAHKMIAPLQSSAGRLDTGPDAYHAQWSADSRHVAVNFRIERHEEIMELFEVRGGRAQLVKGPELIETAAKGIKPDSDDHKLLTRLSTLKWLTPTTFMLGERRLFRANSPTLAKTLGALARQADDDNTSFPGKNYLVTFSAEATAELGPGGRYRVGKLKPGAFD